MPAAIPANPTFTPTTTADLCQAATSYGFGDEWDCPSWDHLLNFNLLDARCDAKIAALQEIASEVTYLRSWSNALDAAGGCSGGSPDQSLCAQKAEYDAAVADGEAYFWQVNGTPCYIFS